MAHVEAARAKHAATPAASDARARFELEALHETALGLVGRLELESVLRAIVERAADLVGTDHGYLYLREPGDEALHVRVGTGMFGKLVGYRLAPGEGLGGRVAAERTPLVVDDYSRWEGGRPELQKLPFRAVVGVPLTNGREVTGVLGLAHLDAGHTFDASTVDLLTRFAQLASLALENARLYAAAQDELERRRQTEHELHDSIARLREADRALRGAHQETIRRLGYVAEFRDAGTGEHIERMSRMCALIARRLGLDEAQCELLRAASPLHDLGKIAIPDAVLLKPGPLTPEERTLVETHTLLGHRLLAGSTSEVLEVASTIALTHHERYDGTGYPRGLAGEEIPLAGRIAAVADVFDAMTSDRPYRRAMTIAEALELMRRGRGTQFDPLVLDAFQEVFSETGEAPERAVAQGRTLVAEHSPTPAETSAPDPAASAESLDPVLLRSACDAAEAALREAGSGRRAIEECFAALVSGFEGTLLVSVYVEDHDRLWVIAQRGYREVLDGFSLDHGVMARAVRTGTTQFVPDVATDPEFIEATSGIVSEVTVPLGPRDGSARGALNVETVGVTLPSEARSMFERLAGVLAERLAEMRDGLQVDVATLARLCVHASSLRGTSAIAEFSARTVGRLLELECVQVDLRPDRGAFSLASFWRRDSSGLEPLSAVDVARLALLQEQSGAGAAYHLFDRRQVDPADRDPAPWIVWFPLSVAGGTIGVIVGRSPTRPDFEHERVEAATLFAQHTAALIDVSFALRREQRAATTDSLTGLLNRRGFDERLREELERAEHAGTTVALVLADCDDLKSINDRGGHELGDRVLQAFARCLRSSKRPGDAGARIGGDEFAIVVPGGTTQAGLHIADRLRAELAAARTTLGVPVTASFGVATSPGAGATAADLLRAADRALYAAKRASESPVALSEGVA